MVEIIQKDLLPAVTTYMEKLAQTAALKKSVVPDISVSTEAALLTRLTELSETMVKDLERLKEDTAMAEYEAQTLHPFYILSISSALSTSSDLSTSSTPSISSSSSICV